MRGKAGLGNFDKISEIYRLALHFDRAVLYYTAIWMRSSYFEHFPSLVAKMLHVCKDMGHTPTLHRTYIESTTKLKPKLTKAMKRNERNAFDTKWNELKRYDMKAHET